MIDAPLAHEFVGNGKHMLMILHGILGNRTNWKGFARSLLEDIPGWRVCLVDLRAHGDSKGKFPPHDIHACAEDLAELCAHIGEEPAALAGHSFGGKVAAIYAQQFAADLHSLWILDSTPGLASRSTVSSEVTSVISTLQTVALPIASRRDLVEELKNKGLALSIARWMTTNVRSTRDGFVWRFDLDIVAAMLESYAHTDAWGVFDRPPSGLTIDFVRGENSDRWDEDDKTHLELLASEKKIRLHVLENAGHWVHTDNPEGLQAMMSRGLAQLRSPEGSAARA